MLKKTKIVLSLIAILAFSTKNSFSMFSKKYSTKSTTTTKTTPADKAKALQSINSSTPKSLVSLRITMDLLKKDLNEKIQAELIAFKTAVAKWEKEANPEQLDSISIDNIKHEQPIASHLDEQSKALVKLGAKEQQIMESSAATKAIDFIMDITRRKKQQILDRTKNEILQKKLADSLNETISNNEGTEQLLADERELILAQIALNEAID